MIGIFDSGSGGLTVLRAIRDVLPSSDILYFGDIAHAPYGPRSREELSMLTLNGIRLLRERGARRIVSACNSVSASLAVSLYDAFEILPNELIEMVGPTVASFKGAPDRVLLCATEATVSSGIYQNAFRMIGKDIQTLALPALAAAIEFGESEEKVDAIVAAGLSDVDWSAVDTVVLACTHYPLALASFQLAIAARDVEIFDPALVVAERAERLFWPQEVGNGTMRFLISADSTPFRDLVACLFPSIQYVVEVVE